MISKRMTIAIIGMASAVIMALAATPMATSLGTNNSQNLQKVMAQTYPTGTDAKMNNTAATKSVSPSKTTDKEFWINTVHLDGMTNINPGKKCDTCPQNTPLHPAEQPPANSSIPTGGGFALTQPNKAGAWDFRSFTFAPDQIVVIQGDKVTLHFVGVQGPRHLIDIEGVETFELTRGQIHTVSFVASNPGTISYYCHVHPPNMVGEILVLPKAA